MIGNLFAVQFIICIIFSQANSRRLNTIKTNGKKQLITDNDLEAIQSNAVLSMNFTIVTWNLAESSPSEKDCQFMKALRANEDIIVVGVQVNNCTCYRWDTKKIMTLCLQTLDTITVHRNVRISNLAVMREDGRECGDLSNQRPLVSYRFYIDSSLF